MNLFTEHFHWRAITKNWSWPALVGLGGALRVSGNHLLAASCFVLAAVLIVLKSIKIAIDNKKYGRVHRWLFAGSCSIATIGIFAAIVVNVIISQTHPTSQVAVPPPRVDSVSPSNPPSLEVKKEVKTKLAVLAEEKSKPEPLKTSESVKMQIDYENLKTRFNAVDMSLHRRFTDLGDASAKPEIVSGLEKCRNDLEAANIAIKENKKEEVAARLEHAKATLKYLESL